MKRKTLKPMRTSCANHAHISTMKVKYHILRGMLAFTLLVVIISFVIVVTSVDKSEPVSEAYDYADMRLQITVSPFDDLKPSEFDAQALRTKNNDFRAWLQIPDTEISFPVVQGTDNAYYLKHSFVKRYSSFGCLFLDYRTTLEDRNLVIHGHNMGLNRTEMFSTLVNYQNQTYAEEHETIFYCDPDRAGEERYTVFAVLNLDIYNADQFNYRQQQFESDAAFQMFVSYLKDHSIFASEYEPTGELIILSTCNRAYGESNRLLICAGRDRET